MELKSTVSEIKISLEGFKGRFNQVEEKIGEVEDRARKLLSLKSRKKKE